MPRGPSPVELVADCDACGLESGVVETYDALVPACRFGLPATARCKLCGDTHEGRFDRAPARPLAELPANRCPACERELAPSAIDERRCAACGARAERVRTAEPEHFLRRGDLERALDAWAAREGFASRQALVDATFCEPDVGRIFARIDHGERIEVVADPFANMGVRAAGRSGDEKRRADDRDATVPDPKIAFAAADTIPLAEPLAADAHAPGPPPARAPARAPAPANEDTHAPPPSAPPRAIVYPLLSLIAADGEIHPKELALVDAFLRGEGLAPLSHDELCVHHPSEVAHLVPKERREAVVQLMCEAAAVDGMPDESERRVIRAYANAWDVPDEKVDFWLWGYESMGTGIARQLWLKIRRFVLSARWSDEGKV
jgi:uncharacterized tellurite resistance protein B-like protein